MNYPSYNSRMPNVVRCAALLFLAAAAGWAQSAGAAPLTIVTKQLPPASLWSPYGLEHRYGFSLQAEGGVGPHHWRIVSGSLPHGMNLDGASGMISGTPEQGGEFELSILLGDKVQSVTKKYTLTVETPLAIRWDSTATV